MAGGHLDQEMGKALSEGDAAVKSVSPDDKIPNAEAKAVSVTKEQVGDEIAGTQEVGPGDEDDGEKRLCVTTEEVSPSGATDSAAQRDASGITGDAVDLPEKKDEAWSANEVRANVPDGTWSAEKARGEARDGTCSAVDCNNGAQVTVVADDGGASADALVHSEVGGVEQGLLSRTGANVAAVDDDGVISPLVTMEPRDPTVKENVPAVDDQEKDSDGVSSSKRKETLPTGSLPEVDTAQAVTGKAKPLARNDDGSVSTECKVDDLVELTGVQDKQLAPKMETRDVPGAEETIPVSEEPTKEVPKEGALDTPGKHCYQAGDLINGLVRCINVYGAYLEHGDLNVLIPAEGKNTPPFMVGDTVNGTVKRVEDDGTVILDTYLILEEDEEDSSSRCASGKTAVGVCGGKIHGTLVNGTKIPPTVNGTGIRKNGNPTGGLPISGYPQKNGMKPFKNNSVEKKSIECSWRVER